MSQIIEYNKCSIIIVSEEMMKYVEHNEFLGLYKEKIFYIKRWYGLISKDHASRIEPKFKTLSQLKNGLKTYICE